MEPIGPEILNACYLVRHYARPAARARHAEALERLGRIVRAALERERDYAEIFAAIVAGLAPDDRPRWCTMLEDPELGRRRRR